MHGVDFSRFCVCGTGQPDKGRTGQESGVPRKSMGKWRAEEEHGCAGLGRGCEGPTTLGWSFKNWLAVMAKAKPWPTEKGWRAV